MGYYNNDFTKMDNVKDLLNAYQERDLACFQEHAKTALDKDRIDILNALFSDFRSVGEDASDEEIEFKLKFVESVLACPRNPAGQKYFYLNGLLAYVIENDCRNVKLKCGCLEILIKYGADVNAVSPSKSEPYLFEAKESAVIETLLRHRADPNNLAFAYDESAGLGVSVIENFLKQHVPSPNLYIHKDRNRNYEAIFEDAAKSIELLINHRAPVNAVKTKRMNRPSPLMRLCELKRTLLTSNPRFMGADMVEAKQIMDRYLPYLDKFLERVYDMLTEAGADVNYEDSSGNSPATVCTSSKLLKKLIAAGSDINKRNKSGKTLLCSLMDRMSVNTFYYIFCNDKYEIIDAFIEQARLKNLSFPDEYGTTLHKAVRHKDIDIIRRLAEAGADVNYRSKESGMTPLFNYFSLTVPPESMYKVDVLRTMDDLGADFCARDNKGNTLLHWWAHLFVGYPPTILKEYKFAELLDRLVECGADVNAVDGSGYTAAAILVNESGRYEWATLMPVLTKMVEYGADLYKGGKSSAMALVPYKKYKKELERCIEQKRSTEHVMDDMIGAFER